MILSIFFHNYGKFFHKIFAIKLKSCRSGRALTIFGVFFSAKLRNFAENFRCKKRKNLQKCTFFSPFLMRHGSFRRKIRGPPKISKIFTSRGVAEVLFALERAHLRLLFFCKIAAILQKILSVKIFF